MEPVQRTAFRSPPPLPNPAGVASGEAPVERLGPRVRAFGGLMVVMAVATLVLMLRGFSSESYLYLFFYSIPSNAAVSIFPHEPVVIWFGKEGSPWLTAAAASAGTLVAGFMDHTVFVPVLNLRSLQGYRQKGWYRKAVGWFVRYPFATLAVVGFLPLPFFPLKFLSFSVRYPLARYLGALLTGRFPRYLLLAWAGALLEIPNGFLIGVFAAIFLVYGVKAGPAAARRLRAGRLRAGRAAGGGR